MTNTPAPASLEDRLAALESRVQELQANAATREDTLIEAVTEVVFKRVKQVLPGWIAKANESKGAPRFGACGSGTNETVIGPDSPSVQISTERRRSSQ